MDTPKLVRHTIKVNDFPMLINKISDVVMFVDDTSILITADSQSELLQRFNHILTLMSKYEGDSKSKGKIHLTTVIEITVSNFTYYFST